jgi:t-SNARE complex subunit (syntaxin)
MCSGSGNCSYVKFEGKIIPDLRDKIEEYIKELETEVERLTKSIEDSINTLDKNYIGHIKTRIDAYVNVINDLRNNKKH